MHRPPGVTFALTALFVGVLASVAVPSDAVQARRHGAIEHVVVIFQENRSFDSYFGTYPYADGFLPRPQTSVPNNLRGYPLARATQHNELLPHRITDDVTPDLPHDQATMLKEYNGGRLDQFVQQQTTPQTRSLVMGYYDYEVVPHYWHYAQQYALADQYFSSMFGSSTPAALFLAAARSAFASNPYPEGDRCNPPDKPTGRQDGPNLGSALSAADVSWGWYQGGFDDCTTEVEDYDAHHNPFQYFDDTADPEHTGTGHQHDLADFYAALKANRLPSVAYLKADRPRNEHPGYSSISGGRDFVVRTLNAIMRSDAWASTVVILTFDESGGFYDHAPPPQVVLSGVELGLGPRVPTLVISPFARSNYLSHRTYDHASVVRFIEDVFLDGVHLNGRSATAGDLRDMLDLTLRTPALLLDPKTGKPVEDVP